ncbi:acid-sensing ion channel 3 isoform X1 [Poecile atricapillus]|uniref:acid-sensing ion channel 3 isoform X1 n=1 Tax=Poecile atricapillus TaxID=48891 RepID=UPI0027389A28|nr:acid-sensing ion channel 3 isoform X1 [Poecile atricapillus]
MRRGSEGSGEGEGLSSLRAFAHSSSLHGISHVFAYGAVSLRRVLWGGFFLGSLGLLLLVCAERVAYFLTYPHVTKLDEVAARNLTFPAITICNLNEFRFSKITRNDMYHVGELLALLNERYEISNPQLAEPHVLAALRDKANFKNFKAKPFSMAEFYNRTGHDLADMLLQCSFRGTGCTARNFTVIFTRLGKCYTFNPGGPGREVLTTLQGGSGNGLELMLNVQQEEYLPVWGDTDETSFEVGVKVQIHSQDEPPFIDQLGFGVAPGFQTFVSCQQQRLVYLPPPWGDCKATPIESDFFTNYSLTACRLDCETRYLAENCNCRMVHMPGNANVCTPEQYKECADPALDFLVTKDSEYCACRTPCAMVRYGKELSMVKIPSKASAKYLAKKFNKTEQYIADNVLVLDIFFEALNYEMIEQKKAYEVAGLLGDIGGQMGLFIGASLLTILEIFDYLYEVFRDKLLSLYKEKKRSPRSDGGTLEHPAVPGSPTAPRPPRYMRGGNQSPPGAGRGVWGWHSLGGDEGPWEAQQGQHGGAGPFPADLPHSLRSPPPFSANLSFPVDPPIPCRHPPSSSSPTAPRAGVPPALTPLSRAGVPQPLSGTQRGRRGRPGGGHGRGQPGSRVVSPPKVAPGPPWGHKGQSSPAGRAQGAGGGSGG